MGRPRAKTSVLLKIVFNVLALIAILILVYMIVNVAPEPPDDRDFLKKEAEVRAFMQKMDKKRKLGQ